MPSGRNALRRHVRVCVDQPLGDRGGEHRAEAEPADREPGDQAALVGEPLQQHRDRHDVGEAEPEPADHAVPEDEQPQLVAAARRTTARSDADRVDDPADQRDHARAPCGPGSGRRCRLPMKIMPIVTSNGSDASHPAEVERRGVLQRLGEDAPRVDGADRELQQQRRPRRAASGPARRPQRPSVSVVSPVSWPVVLPHREPAARCARSTVRTGWAARASSALALRDHGVLRVAGGLLPSLEDPEPRAGRAGEQRRAGERRRPPGCGRRAGPGRAGGGEHLARPASAGRPCRGAGARR